MVKAVWLTGQLGLDSCFSPKHYDAVTESHLATAAVWSYGLAAVAYVVFAVRLALGWRRNSRAMLLMA